MRQIAIAGCGGSGKSTLARQLGAIRRRFQYHGKPRPDMAPGCPEKLDWAFLKWIWTYPAARRSAMLQRLERYADGRAIIILRNSAEVRRFLGEVAEVSGA